MTDELKPDPEIAAALRNIEQDPPMDAVNWTALHRRILARTIVSLGARRVTWLDVTAGWAKAAIPLATAAIVVLAFWLPGQIDRLRETANSSDVSARDALTLSVSGDAHDHEIVNAMVLPKDGESPVASANEAFDVH